MSILKLQQLQDDLIAIAKLKGHGLELPLDIAHGKMLGTCKTCGCMIHSWIESTLSPAGLATIQTCDDND